MTIVRTLHQISTYNEKANIQRSKMFWFFSAVFQLDSL